MRTPHFRGSLAYIYINVCALCFEYAIIDVSHRKGLMLYVQGIQRADTQGREWWGTMKNNSIGVTLSTMIVSLALVNAVVASETGAASPLISAAVVALAALLVLVESVRVR